jgi:hypothetical protein
MLMAETCLVQAYAKMNQASMSSLETLKDLDQTVGMLRRPFRGSIELVGRIIKSRNKHSGKSARSAAQALQGAWLEHRYGWKPLLMDCDNIITFSQKKREKLERRRLVSRAGASRSFNDVLNLTVPVPGHPAPPGVTSVSGTTLYQKTVRVGCGVFYDVVNRSTSDDLLKLLGARPNDLPVGIWECIPYSFVVDWFVNVSDWLNAVTPNPSVSVRGNWTTSVVEAVDTTQGVKVYSYVGTAPASSYTTSVPGSIRRSGSVTRRVNRPMPSHPSVINKPLSLLHSLDGVCLLGQKVLSALGKLKV